MEIGKEMAVKGVGTPDGAEMALINALARRELAPEEVYAFALRLCDNDVDRDSERFDDEALDRLGELFVGVAGVFDHQWSAKGQTARIYRTRVEAEDVLTSDGRPYRCLKAWAYMMRTGENAALIAEIDGGIKREVSVGCAVERTVCSICGEELGDCPHEKGREYGGELCCGILTEPTDAYEWSFVAVPAQRRAGVVKSARRQIQEEARLGRRYLKGLRAELVRLAGIAEPELEHPLLEKAAGKLDEEELLGFIKLYRGRVDGMLGAGPQLSYGREEPPAERADGAFLI